MPTSYVFKKMIREEMKKLSRPVKLRVFIDKNKNSEFQDYEYSMSILKVYEEASNGLLTIEELSVSENPDLAKKYEVQRVPTILFIDNEGNELIRYLAAPQGSEIQPFIQALLIFGGAPNYYEVAIRENLNRIVSSTIKVMITNSCVYCPQVVNIASQFALASGGKIRTVIIDIMENPDIGQIYDTSCVPYTVINEKELLVGIVGPKEIFKELMGEKIRI